VRADDASQIGMSDGEWRIDFQGLAPGSARTGVGQRDLGSVVRDGAVARDDLRKDRDVVAQRAPSASPQGCPYQPSTIWGPRREPDDHGVHTSERVDGHGLMPSVAGGAPELHDRGAELDPARRRASAGER